MINETEQKEPLPPESNIPEKNSGETNLNDKGKGNTKDKLSARRVSRILAMEIFFSLNFTKYSLPLTIEMFGQIEDSETPRPKITQFTVDLVAQTLKNIKAIDEDLKKIIKNWKPERLGIIDRTLLRLGAAEIKYFADIPPKVSINEYIEIAKDYSEDDAPGFINGILDKLARNSEKLKT